MRQNWPFFLSWKIQKKLVMYWKEDSTLKFRLEEEGICYWWLIFFLQKSLLQSMISPTKRSRILSLKEKQQFTRVIKSIPRRMYISGPTSINRSWGLVSAECESPSPSLPVCEIIIIIAHDISNAKLKPANILN